MKFRSMKCRSIKLCGLLLSLCSVFLFTACSSDSGSDGGASIVKVDDRDTIIDGTGVWVTGVIQDFGSIIVDDVRYSTDGAEIFDNGQLVSQDMLSVGDYITFEVFDIDTDSPRAEQILHEPPVLGQITAIDLDARTMEIFGQTVFIRDDTIFGESVGGTSIGSLNIGDLIEVSGRFGDNELFIDATRLERKVTSIVSASGTVTGQDVNQQTLTLSRGLVVVYSEIDGADDLQLEVGNSRVTVSGSRIEGILVATELSVSPADAETIKTSISTFLSAGTPLGIASSFDGVSFDLGIRTVTVDENTQFVGGTREQLFDMPFVEVEPQSESASRDFVAGTITFIDVDLPDDGSIDPTESPLVDVFGIITDIQLPDGSEDVVGRISILAFADDSGPLEPEQALDFVLDSGTIAFAPVDIEDDTGELPSDLVDVMDLSELAIGDSVSITSDYEDDSQTALVITVGSSN